MSNEQECVHHWILESPNGATSQGICKKCNTEKAFRNSPEWMDDGRNGSHWQKRQKGTYAHRLAVLENQNTE